MMQDTNETESILEIKIPTDLVTYQQVLFAVSRKRQAQIKGSVFPEAKEIPQKCNNIQDPD